jgi:hypothetical protein
MAALATMAQSLAVPFAAGFVVQRVLEIADPFFPNSVQHPNRKKILMGILSLILGWVFAFCGVRVFGPLGFLGNYCFADSLLSGIFISAGTEGFNSLLKFANYQKEASKADAAEKKAAAGTAKLQMVNPQV